MKNLYESIQPILEASQNQGGGYNYIISLEKDFKSTQDSELDKYRDPRTGRDRYVKMVCTMLGILSNENEKDDDKSILSRFKKFLGTAEAKKSDADILRNYRTFVEFVQGAWHIWVYDWGGQKDKIPFRFNGSKSPKIARIYDDYRMTARNWPKSKESMRIGYITVKVGNGLGKGQGGMKFENEIFGGLCQYIANGCQLSGLKLSKVVYDTIVRIHESGLREPIKEFSKTFNKEIKGLSGQDLVNEVKDWIVQAGKQDVNRHIADVFQGPTSALDQDAIYNARKSSLNASGKKISDITILNPEAKDNEDREIYLSIKDSRAQLSGVVVSPSKNGINWMDEYLDMDPDSRKLDTPASKEFKSFWTTIGLRPGDVVKAFSQVKENMDNDTAQNVDIKVSAQPSKRLGEIIQWLIGGNYWYVSPKKVLYISDEPQNWSFTAERAYITKTGRTVNIIGKLSGVPMTLVIRTSDIKRKYPNRMFPKVDVEQLLELKGEEI